VKATAIPAFGKTQNDQAIWDLMAFLYKERGISAQDFETHSADKSDKKAVACALCPDFVGGVSSSIGFNRVVTFHNMRNPWFMDPPWDRFHYLMTTGPVFHTYSQKTKFLVSGERHGPCAKYRMLCSGSSGTAKNGITLPLLSLHPGPIHIVFETEEMGSPVRCIQRIGNQALLVISRTEARSAPSGLHGP
jgi:hypothetical protein